MSNINKVNKLPELDKNFIIISSILINKIEEGKRLNIWSSVWGRAETEHVVNEILNYCLITFKPMKFDEYYLYGDLLKGEYIELMKFENSIYVLPTLKLIYYVTDKVWDY